MNQIPLGTLINFAPISGIYKIENVITKRVYIGQSKHIYSRLASHADALYKKCHPCKNMQNDFDKYGYLSFDIEIVHECSHKLLLDTETEVIKQYHKNKIELYNEKLIL